MRVVIDTNVIFSSLIGGNPRRVVDLWKSGKLVLCISPEIIDEYYQSLLRNPDVIHISDLFFSAFTKQTNILFTNATSKLELVEDPDDNKFIECAEALNAEYVISGDRALLAVIRYKNIKIVTPKKFLDEFINVNK